MKHLLSLFKYAVLLAIFAALFLNVRANLSDIRRVTDNRLASSTRLEDASRSFVEMQNFQLSAYQFVQGSPTVTKEDVTLKFDLFWSRAEALGKAADYKIVQDLDTERTLFSDTRAALKSADPLVSGLQRGDQETLRKIEAVLHPIHDRIEGFARAAYNKRLARALELADAQRVSTRQLDKIQTAFLLFGLISPFFLMAEIMRVRKLNRRIAEREGEIVQLGLTDSLTGLCNRRSLMQDLVIDGDAGEPQMSLLLLDLDGFKAVNDTFGHPVGDELLKKVSERLKAIAPEGVTVARLGGDEFALAGHIEQGSMAQLASHLIVELEKSVDIGGRAINISASIGMACSAADMADTANVILSNADIALYEAKNAGRGCLRIYDPEIRQKQSYQTAIEDSLADAIDNGEIRVFYHPQIDVSTMKTVGVEALVRWHHPVHGNIPPDDFVKVAERTGLIRKLDFFVLETACREIRVLARAGIKLRLAVNVSPVEAGRRGYARELLETLDRIKFPRDVLTLELTENAVMEDFKIVERNLNLLVEAGVSIAIDDFGAGYSNLSYLARFPFSYLKVDRVLAQNLATESKDRTVVEGIVKLAKGLDLLVIVEGVETAAQLTYLREIGVPEAQGFFFSEPLSEERLIPFLSTFAAQSKRSLKPAGAKPLVLKPVKATEAAA